MAQKLPTVALFLPGREEYSGNCSIIMAIVKIPPQVLHQPETRIERNSPASKRPRAKCTHLENDDEATILLSILVHTDGYPESRTHRLKISRYDPAQKIIKVGGKRQ